MKDLALSPAADLLFSASSDGTIKAWRLQDPLVSVHVHDSSPLNGSACRLSLVYTSCSYGVCSGKFLRGSILVDRCFATSLFMDVREHASMFTCKCTYFVVQFSWI